MSYKCIAAVFALAVHGAGQNLYNISTIAGANALGDGGRATNASFSSIEGIAVDSLGNLLIADGLGHRIRRVSQGGIIITLAGTSIPGFSPDETPVGRAQLNAPYGLAAGASGHVFIADFGNALVRCLTPTGTIRTVAGGGAETDLAVATPLTLRLGGPRNVALDAAGNLYVADYSGHRVYRITTRGQVEVVAGTGAAGRDTVATASLAKLNGPTGLAIDLLGYVYIADSNNGLVRRVFGGQISTVVTGLNIPTGLATDPAGDLYIVDAKNKRVVRRSRAGDLRSVAAEVKEPRDVAVDGLGNLYVAEPRRVWRVGQEGVAVRYAGLAANAEPREDTPAEMAVLAAPFHVSMDPNGNLLVTEEEGRRVRRIAANGTIRTLAGPAHLNDPVAAVMDARGVLRVADYAGNRVWSFAPDGTASVLAGDGTGGYRGDNGLASASRLFRPRGLALDRSGNLYVADSMNHRVRRIGTNGVITTYAGTGFPGYSGDGRLATQAQLNSPAGLFVDVAGALYIADTGNHRIRKVLTNGIAMTVAGNGSSGDEGDGALALQAALNAPLGVVVDASGVLFIADTFNQRIRRVGVDGVIQTIAGDGTPGADGDGESALAARFQLPTSVALDASGNVYVADHQNHRLRKLAPAAVPPPEVQGPPELSLLHAATMEPGPFAPGQLVVVRNPATDLRIQVDGKPVTPLSSTTDRVMFQLPVTASNEVNVNGRTLVLVPSAPGVFAQDGRGQAVAVNDDGSLNSEDNPAARGSPLAFFTTGEGRATTESVEARVGNANAEVLFAGPAPGLPGIFQINVKLPGIFTPPGVRALTVTAAGVLSQGGVTVAVR